MFSDKPIRPRIPREDDVYSVTRFDDGTYGVSLPDSPTEPREKMDYRAFIRALELRDGSFPAYTGTSPTAAELGWDGYRPVLEKLLRQSVSSASIYDLAVCLGEHAKKHPESADQERISGGLTEGTIDQILPSVLDDGRPIRKARFSSGKWEPGDADIISEVLSKSVLHSDLEPEVGDEAEKSNFDRYFPMTSHLVHWITSSHQDQKAEAEAKQDLPERTPQDNFLLKMPKTLEQFSRDRAVARTIGKDTPDKLMGDMLSDIDAEVRYRAAAAIQTVELAKFALDSDDTMVGDIVIKNLAAKFPELQQLAYSRSASDQPVWEVDALSAKYWLQEGQHELELPWIDQLAKRRNAAQSIDIVKHAELLQLALDSHDRQTQLIAALKLGIGQNGSQPEYVDERSATFSAAGIPQGPESVEQVLAWLSRPVVGKAPVTLAVNRPTSNTEMVRRSIAAYSHGSIEDEGVKIPGRISRTGASDMSQSSLKRTSKSEQLKMVKTLKPGMTSRDDEVTRVFLGSQYSDVRLVAARLISPKKSPDLALAALDSVDKQVQFVTLTNIQIEMPECMHYSNVGAEGTIDVDLAGEKFTAKVRIKGSEVHLIELDRVAKFRTRQEPEVDRDVAYARDYLDTAVRRIFGEMTKEGWMVAFRDGAGLK
jgi:hypothetical protein